MKALSLFVAAVLTFSTPISTFAANAACSRFKPGHYFTVADDNTRKVNGLGILQNKLAQDVRNFKGVVYMMPWGMLEKSKGVYDFSRLDAALAQVRAKNKYLVLRFMDRTFWTGCSSTFVPSYVPKEKSANASEPNTCYSKIWETTTADNMIRVLQQVVSRYKNEPAFLGITMEETSMLPTSFAANRDMAYTLYEQLKRTARSVHAVAPALIFNQGLNWPRSGIITPFYKIADNLVAMGGGGAVGWPDTSLANQYVWNWYDVGRDYRSKLLVMADVQTSFIGTSLTEHDNIYKMLNNDIQSHMMVWAIWHRNLGDAYFTSVVIPTVNKYNGAVKNTVCPFQ
jgi:hypothetical protein